MTTPFRHEAVDEVENADGEGVGNFLELGQGLGVAGFGLRLHAGGVFPGQAGQGAAGAEALQGRSGAVVDDRVAGFRQGPAALQEAAVEDHARAHAGAGGDVEHVGRALSRAVAVLAHGGQVGVVGEEDGKLEGVGQRAGREVALPGGQIGEAEDLAGGVVHWPGDAHHGCPQGEAAGSAALLQAGVLLGGLLQGGGQGLRILRRCPDHVLVQQRAVMIEDGDPQAGPAEVGRQDSPARGGGWRCHGGSVIAAGSWQQCHGSSVIASASRRRR